MTAHKMAPPDAGFASRLRALATAADAEREAGEEVRRLACSGVARAFAELASAAGALADAVDAADREAAGQQLRQRAV